MEEYRRGTHSVFRLHVHLCWCTKYRRTALEGDVAHRLRDLTRQYWGQQMWARGYFACTTGNVTDDMIRSYIEGHTETDEDFRIVGDFQSQPNRPGSGGLQPASAGKGTSSARRKPPACSRWSG